MSGGTVRPGDEATNTGNASNTAQKLPVASPTCMELKERMISDLIGLPVVSMDGGLKMGTVKDVLIDTDDFKATALLVSGDSGRGGLPFEKVLSFGPDAVMVETGDVIFWASAVNPGPGRESNEIKGLPVVNKSGAMLGNVRDISLCGDHVHAIEIRAGGVLGIGATDTEIMMRKIRSIGPTLVTVDTPTP